MPDKNSFLNSTTCMLTAKGEWQLVMIFFHAGMIQYRSFTFFLHGSRSSLMATNFQSVQFKSSKFSTYHDGNTFQYEKMGVSKISKPPNLFFEMVVFLHFQLGQSNFSAVWSVASPRFETTAIFTKWRKNATWDTIAFLGPGARHIALRRGRLGVSFHLR